MKDGKGVMNSIRIVYWLGKKRNEDLGCGVNEDVIGM
jgi:hypothetical protein